MGAPQRVKNAKSSNNACKKRIRIHYFETKHHLDERFSVRPFSFAKKAKKR
jgi:hypothetical protein